VESTRPLRLDTAISRDPNLLCPVFYSRVQVGLAHAKLDGHQVEIFEGWRSPQRQDWLYAQGRTASGKIVTKARAWQSWHQFGLAVDLAYFEGGKWSWDHDFTKLTPYFEGVGLEWLGPNDAGHYELTKGLRLDQAFSLVKNSGLQRLWMEVSG
jgi:hypothetical protein